MVLLNKQLSEKEEKLRRLLLNYTNGTLKQQRKTEKNVANGIVNLDEYKDIVEQEDFNKTYKSIYYRLKNNAEKMRISIEENSIKNKPEEQESQKILKMFKLSSNYYLYDINTLEELLVRTNYLIDSNNIYFKTKKDLQLVKKELSLIIEDFRKREKYKEEQVLKELSDRYYNGEKEKVIREIFQNEKQYLKYAKNPNISQITKKRFNPIKEHCLLLKKEIQSTLIIQLIAYLSKEDSDIYGKYQREYNDFYNRILPNYHNRDLSKIISPEDKIRIDNIIKEIKEKKIEEALIEGRGYSEENLSLIKQLIEHYKNNQPIINLSSRVGIDKKRMSKYMLSTYLIKFENETVLSETDFETYKEFAEKYGDKLLSWIILEKDIKETDTIDITVIKREIEALLRRIKFDKSLYEEEKDTITNRINLFLEKIDNQTSKNKIKTKKY